MKTTLPLLGLCWLALGCATEERQSDYTETGSPPHRSYSTAAPDISDADRGLASVVRDQFDRYGALSAIKYNIVITARNGVVTLNGTVPGRQEKNMVQAMVENTPGVVAVNNHLKATSSTPLPFDQSDRALVSRVRQAFKEQPPVAAYAPNIGIEANSGIVTLTGTVATEHDRQLLANIVENTSGVQKVVDRMEYPVTANGRSEPRASADSGEFFNLSVRGNNESDRELAQRILSGVRTDTALAATLPVVNIQIADGRVTLHGTVQSEEQRSAVIAAIRRAAGTESVYDDLRMLSAK
jgi:osmotically-inducible protein OsmY